MPSKSLNDTHKTEDVMNTESSLCASLLSI